MNDQDFKAFGHAWSAAYELCSRGKTASPGAINLAFEALREYPLEQVTAALTRHLRTPDSKYGLTTGDIVLQIDGPPPTVDRIIGAAMKPDTPLAVLCRIEIGSWNLGNLNHRDLRPYAERCIQKLPEFRQRLATNALAEHERRALERHGVSLDNVRQLDGARRLEGGGA